MINHSTHM